MNERCSPSGDRIEVPVRWISEIDLTVSEKVKTEPTDLFCCCNQLVAMLSAGSGHWNSPIVIDGRVALPEGDANHHATSGVLDIWRLRKA